MAQTKMVTLDVRTIPPWERHPKIFEIFDSLAAGEKLVIVNDHDPRPLHYQFMMEREGLFQWQSEERGPREWVATIARIK